MLTRRTFLVSTVAGLFTPSRTLFQASRPDLLILHTNDLHGRVRVRDRQQGLAFLAEEIQKARASGIPNLLLDAGDIIHGTPVEARLGPAPVLGALNALRYDAATVGNHEFDFGPENLRHAGRIAKFPLLSANVRTSDGDPWGPLRPYIVLNRGGRRIGVFGLTTETTPSIQWPRTIESIRFTDAEAAARECVRTLRERERVDVVVALSHLGYQPDRKLAHEAPGIDIVIGGHSHTRLERAVVENDVPIVQTGAHGVALGHLEARFDGRRPRFEYRLLEATDVPTPAPGVMAAYGPYQARMERELAQTLGTLTAPLTSEGLTKRATPTGRFLAEAVRAAHGTDVGLFSSSQFDGEIPAGPVRRDDVYNAMQAYTRQHIVRAEVPGFLLRAEIQRQNPSGKAAVQVAAGEIFGTRRYQVASPAHVMQDMFLGKPGVKILFDDPLGPTVRDAVMGGIQRGLRVESVRVTA
jgi:2',3'-cyclic-nucleotide 2'-phosphodiesterase (5'-nucleotidase family)